uniref:EF-hand domain-containing protein n=1 Tax=Schistosoma mattheei TaxID=31246 RepID=A0AA85ASH5_9TREM
MHYKETFLHKWIELFDPEHTGFITYEQYCKTLGLIPRKRTLSKNLTDSTLLSSSVSSSSLSISSKQDNVNETFIGSFDKNVNETNITTIIQQSHSNEPNQKIEQTIITTEQHSTIHIQIDQTIKNTCTLKQSEVEINETEQQQQNEFPNQSNNPIHQNINNDSTNLPMINNQNIIIVNDEQLNNKHKPEFIDEDMVTVKENIIS